MSSGTVTTRRALVFRKSLAKHFRTVDSVSVVLRCTSGSNCRGDDVQSRWHVAGEIKGWDVWTD